MIISRLTNSILPELRRLFSGGMRSRAGAGIWTRERTLVIQGGGYAAGTGIYETFINLAGGPGAKIIIVPTAAGNRDASGKIKVYKEEEVIGSWKKLGLTNVHMLHTADPKEADTEDFARILRDAKGVWFVGGRQWNIVDSYANTLTLRNSGRCWSAAA